MNDKQLLDWIQANACGFRRGLNDDEYYLDWIDEGGHVQSTNGCNLKNAVIGAKLQREAAGGRVDAVVIQPVDDVKVQARLVKEALVRQIRDAKRWTSIKESWEALLSVERMSKGLIEERQYLHPKDGAGEAV